MPKKLELPEYLIQDRSVANAITRARTSWAAALEKLEAELTRTERRLAEAFEREDEARGVQARIDRELAAQRDARRKARA